MSKEDRAKQFANGFNNAGKGLLKMMETAIAEKYPQALKMSLSEYVQFATKGQSLKLPADERRKEAKRLTEGGLSQREAAAALSVGQSTIQRDLSDPNGSKVKDKSLSDGVSDDAHDPNGSPSKAVPHSSDKARIEKQQRAGTIHLLSHFISLSSLFVNVKTTKRTVSIAKKYPKECEEFWHKDFAELLKSAKIVRDGAQTIIDQLGE